MLKRKIVSCFLVLLLLASSGFGLISVHAAEGESAWTELLETTTVNNSGSNWFKYNGTATVSIPTPYSMRLTKIDMLLTYPANTAPTKVEVLYSGNAYELTMRRIDECTSRVFGTIQQNFYSDVRVRFSRGGTSTAYLEILSCRVSQVIQTEQVASAQVVFDNTFYPTNYYIEVPGDDLEMNEYKTIRIDVQDWMKYDTLSVWGSASYMALTSVRVNLATLGLPYEMSYIQKTPTGEDTSYTERFTYTDSSTGGFGNISGDLRTAFQYGGQVVYCITIDLRNIDRTLTEGPLSVYMTGVYFGAYGFAFNCQYVNGSILVPDKSEIGWWTRFTSFMEGLFGGDTSQSDQFQQDAGQQREEFDQMNDQLEAVTKPPVENVQTDVGAYLDPVANAHVSSVFQSFASSPLITTMMLITLTVALVGYILFGKR